MGWKCFREEDGEERSGAGRLKPWFQKVRRFVRLMRVKHFERGEAQDAFSNAGGTAEQNELFRPGM